MSGVYELGEEVLLTGTFTDTETDTPTDPSLLVVTLVRPDGEIDFADAELIAGDPAGDWRATFTADQSGIWNYHVQGTGSVEAIGTGAVYVRPPVVTGEGS